MQGSMNVPLKFAVDSLNVPPKSQKPNAQSFPHRQIVASSWTVSTLDVLVDRMSGADAENFRLSAFSCEVRQ